jgi:cyclase
MLKRRLIPVLFLKNGLIVRSEGFHYHQNIGNILAEARRYNEWNVDELIYIDISREKFYDLRRDDLNVASHDNILDIIEEISKVCFMPLTFGGGIRTIEDIRQRLRKGADKVTLNTAALENPEFITEASKIFGAQCIVVSIDYKDVQGKPTVFKGGHTPTEWDPLEWAKTVEAKGAGEIFLNSIDRDGEANGFDIEYIGKIEGAVNIPVIACGGCGDPADFVELAKNTNVSGFAAGNMFHFTELSYPRAKNLLIKANVDIRR